MQRKGNALLVFINDNKEAELENVFIPSVKYNLYTFSRYKGNNSDNKNDVFYLMVSRLRTEIVRKCAAALQKIQSLFYNFLF